MSLTLKERAEEYTLDEILRLHKDFQFDAETAGEVGIVEYDGLTCNSYKLTDELRRKLLTTRDIRFTASAIRRGAIRLSHINEQLRPMNSVVNPYAKMLAEYFLSEDKEPRVFEGTTGNGKTLTYMEVLIDLVPKYPELLASAVIYKS